MGKYKGSKMRLWGDILVPFWPFSKKDWKNLEGGSNGFHLLCKKAQLGDEAKPYPYPFSVLVPNSSLKTTRFKTLWHRSKNPLKEEWSTVKWKGVSLDYDFLEKQCSTLPGSLWNATYYWKWVCSGLRCCCQLKKKGKGRKQGSNDMTQRKISFWPALLCSCSWDLVAHPPLIVPGQESVVFVAPKGCNFSQ